MAIFVHAVLPGVTTDQYDQLNARLGETPEVFDGCLSHACVRTDDGLEVFDLWDSEGHMNAFVARMMPLAADLGWPASDEPPRIMGVHKHWVPGTNG